jgi:hypothetical protein
VLLARMPKDEIEHPLDTPPVGSLADYDAHS